MPRPALGERPMTPAERDARRRVKQAVQAAENELLRRIIRIYVDPQAVAPEHMELVDACARDA